jgi:hypothetical protein
MHGKSALLCSQLEMAGVRACVCMSRTVVCATVKGVLAWAWRVCELEGGTAAGLCGFFVVCAAQTLTRLPHRATERPQGQPRERGCIAREGFWCGALLRRARFSFAASSCDVDMDMTCRHPGCTYLPQAWSGMRRAAARLLCWLHVVCRWVS